jgi:hypothetical protein
MNDGQQAKLSMYRSVATVCRLHEQLYADIPAFVNAVMLLNNNIAAIGTNALQQQGTISEGVTVDKSRAGERLMQESVKMANALYVYALDTNNSALQVKANLNKSTLYNGHDGNALVLAKMISEEAHSHEAALAKYGVAPAAIAALDAAVATFEQLVVKPQTIINERKTYTGKLKQLFADTDTILYDRLDKLIAVFLSSAPDFYGRYKNARNIIDTGRRRANSE